MQVEDQFIKISAYKKHDVEPATKELREKYGSRLKITISGDMWMDCMAKDVNKGKAVRTIQESLGIKMEETMAFGDGENDLSMLRAAGLGVAMENGEEQVKQASDFVTVSNNDAGVASAIRKFVLE